MLRYVRADNTEIHEVEGLFVGPQFETDVWVTDAVLESLQKLLQKKDRVRFLEKVKYFATGGFRKFESDNGPIKSEGNHVYRVSQGMNSLFRLIGFYEGAKIEFIGIIAFRKRGRKLSAPQRAKILKVAKVKQQGTWKKKQA